MKEKQSNFRLVFTLENETLDLLRISNLRRKNVKASINME